MRLQINKNWEFAIEKDYGNFFVGFVEDFGNGRWIGFSKNCNS